MQLSNLFSKDFLNSRHPRLQSPWKMLAATTIIVMTALFIFHPWGNVDLWMNIFITLCTGVVTAFTECIWFFLLPKIFKRWFSAEKWTNGKDMLILMAMLFTVALLNYIFFIVVFDMPTSLRVFTIFTVSFLVIVPLPTAFGYMYSQNQRLKHNLQLASQMNKALKGKVKNEYGNEDEIIETDKRVIMPDGTRNHFDFSPSDLLYAASEGNYIKITTIKDGKQTTKMIRSTMKALTTELQGFSYIVRCHRSYIVNIRQVKEVTGNTLECEIHFWNSKDIVPVSRNYRKDILDSLSQHLTSQP